MAYPHEPTYVATVVDVLRGRNQSRLVLCPGSRYGAPPSTTVNPIGMLTAVNPGIGVPAGSRA
jgi:hypothetical protein